MLQEMDKQPKDEPEEDPAEMTHRAVQLNPPIKSTAAAAAPQQTPFVVHHPVQHQPQPKQQPVVIHHPIQQEKQDFRKIPFKSYCVHFLIVNTQYCQNQTEPMGNVTSSPAPAVNSHPVGVRSVAAPTTANKNFKGPEPPQATADNPRCGECDRLIV